MRILSLVLFGFVFGWTTFAAERPNVLFIAVDDLRNDLGCYGNPVVKSPNIDRLAARGVRFERAYVQYPVCNPSRTSFLTGRRPDEIGVTDNTTPMRDKQPDIVTFPQLLRENGWHAAAFGKIFHLGGGRNAALRNKWMDFPKSWNEAQAYEPTATGRELLEARNLTDGKLSWCRWGMAAGTDDDQPDGQTARAAIETMEKLGDKPWLIAVGFQKPHDPFVAPKKYFDMYPLDSLKPQRDPANITAAPPLAVGFGDYGESFRKFTDTERREFMRAYYAGISFTDAQVGRVLDALDRLKLRERTIIIFLSDHGYHLGERDWWNKNTLFDRSCRAPLMVAAPGVKPGVARGIVEFVDVYPTIAELCGVKPPVTLAGKSLRPLLDAPSSAGKPAAFTIVMRGGNQRGDSIRTDRWRYTEWSDGTRELYDHSVDPEETSNLAGATDKQSIIQELAAQLRGR